VNKKYVVGVSVLLKVAVFVIAVAYTTSLLTGCAGRRGQEDYRGEYPELFSVAINSLLGARGYWTSEIRHEAGITIIAEDAYGRIMFSYWERSGISTQSRLIMQKSDESHAYFYPNFNFVSIAPEQLIRHYDENGRFYRASFPEEMIEDLKKLNDWGLPLEPERMVSVEIVRTKSSGPFGRNELRDAYRFALGDYAHNRHVHYVFFRTDEFGRSIYLFSRWSSMVASTDNRHSVVLFLPDGTFDENIGVMRLTDFFNYQSQLASFKELNNWNMPIC